MARDVTIRLGVEGGPQATSAFRTVGDAGEVALEAINRASSRSAASFQRLERSLDLALDAQKRLASAMGQISQAQADGLVTQARAVELADLARQKYLGAGEAARAAAAANLDLARAQEAAAQKAQAYRAAIDPIAEAHRAHAAAIKEINGLAAGGHLTGGEQTTALQRQDAMLKARIAGLDGSAAAAKRAAAAEAALNDQAARFTQFATPHTAALQAINDQRVVANALMERGKISAEVHAAGLQRLAQQEHEVAVAARALAAGTQGGALALRSVAVQMPDVIGQLSAGASVMTTLTQQGLQVAQVMAVTGTSLGTLTGAIRGFVASHAGIIAGGAAFTALAAAVFLVGGRAVALAGQQRELSVAIAGVGKSAELSTDQLQGYVEGLKRQGVATADAVKGIADLTRNPALSGNTIERIAALAPDVAAGRGISVADAMKQMAEAAKGTSEAIRQLDREWNVLSADQAANIHRWAEQGDKARAVDAALSAVRDRFQGLRQQSLSPMGEAIEKLGNAWDRFITSLAKSESVVAAVERLGSAVTAVGNAVDWLGNIGASPGAEIDARIARLQTERAEAARNAETLQRQLTDAQRQYGPPRKPFAPSETTVLEAQIASEQRRVRRIDQQLDPLREQRKALPIQTRGGSEPDWEGSAFLSGLSALNAADERRRKELQDRAFAIVGGTKEGQKEALKRENEQLRAQQALHERGTHLYGVYSAAISENEDKIANLTKTNEQHRTGLEKAADTYEVQIKAANRLAEAYATNRDEVVRILAEQEAQKKAISDGLVPGTEKYDLAVADLTKRIIDLKVAEGGRDISRQVAEADAATEAQLRINAAYDGTAESVARAQNVEKARAEVQRANITDTSRAAEETDRLAAAYDRGSDAARALQLAQQSVQATFDIFSQTISRIGQGLVDAFLQGENRAASFARIGRAAIASIATGIVELGAINPILNSFSSQQRPTLSFGGIGAAGGSGGGLGSLVNSGSNVLSLGRASDALGLTNLGGQISRFTDWIGLTGDGGLLNSVGLAGAGGLLATPVFTSAAAASAAEIYAAAAAAGMEAPALAASTAMAPTTIGGLLGGIGLGFGVGSFGGGLLQSALGKTGPAPTIGAGAGAAAGAIAGSFIPGIGTLVGGLLGGILGGGGGAFIGPRPATPFSATGLTANDAGMLGVGVTVSQLVNTEAEVAALQQSVAQVNALMAQYGARLAQSAISQNRDEFGQTRVLAASTNDWNTAAIGQGGGRSQSLPFSELRFQAANDDVNAAITGRAFESAEALAATLDRASKVTPFLDQTVAALTDLTDRSKQFSDALKGLNETYQGALTFARDALAADPLTPQAADRLRQSQLDLAAAQERAAIKLIDNVTAGLAQSLGAVPAQLKAITDQFGAAIADVQAAVGATPAVTARLVQAEQQLVAARDRQIEQVNTQANAAIATFNAALNVRYLQATANPSQAQLAATDEAARLQRAELERSWTETWGAAALATQAYADQVALLNRTLEAERAAIVGTTEARRQLDAATRVQSAQNILTGFLDQMTRASASPADQFRLAQQDFARSVDQARAGSIRTADLQRLVQTAQALSAAGSERYATGAQNAALQDMIRSTLEAIGRQFDLPAFGGDLETALERATEPLRDELTALREEVADLRAELRVTRLQRLVS